MEDTKLAIDTTSLDNSVFGEDVIQSIRETISMLPERYVPYTRRGQIVRLIAAQPSHAAFQAYGEGARVPAGVYWRDDNIYLNEEYKTSEDIPSAYLHRFPPGILPHASIVGHECGHAIHNDQRYFPLFLEFQAHIWGIAPKWVDALHPGVGGQIQKVGDTTLRAHIAMESWRDMSPEDRNDFELPLLYRAETFDVSDEGAMATFFAEATTGVTEDFAECWAWHLLAGDQLALSRPIRAEWFAGHFPLA